MLQALGTIWFRFLQKKFSKKFHACVPLTKVIKRCCGYSDPYVGLGSPSFCEFLLWLSTASLRSRVRPHLSGMHRPRDTSSKGRNVQVKTFREAPIGDTSSWHLSKHSIVVLRTQAECDDAVVRLPQQWLWTVDLQITRKRWLFH